MISGRSGNGSPESVVSGTASAAASVTAPRRPIQDTTAGRCQGGAASSLSDRPHKRQGTYERGKIQTIRLRITAPPIWAEAPESTAVVRRVCDLMCRHIGYQCMTIRHIISATG